MNPRLVPGALVYSSMPDNYGPYTGRRVIGMFVQTQDIYIRVYVPIAKTDPQEGDNLHTWGISYVRFLDNDEEIR